MQAHAYLYSTEVYFQALAMTSEYELCSGRNERELPSIDRSHLPALIKIGAIYDANSSVKNTIQTLNHLSFFLSLPIMQA